MGGRQEKLSAVNLCPFVGVDINLWPTVHIAVIMLTRTQTILPFNIFHQSVWNRQPSNHGDDSSPEFGLL